MRYDYLSLSRSVGAKKKNKFISKPPDKLKCSGGLLFYTSMPKGKYQEILNYLYRQLPMFQRVGATAFKKDLTNIRALMEMLGNPHLQFKSIHIAGTNGKGSVAHVLSAILQAHGYETGLYTSPHYRDFRERIKLSGQYISRREVVSFVDTYRHEFEKIQPSYFEITVALAFYYFAKRKVDIAVIETGLGGRLDSTNLINPLLSIITNISYDHQAFLGDTLPLIAGEKAGIIKEKTPVVIGETHPETQLVFRNVAHERQAPIVFADQHYRAEIIKADSKGSTFSIQKNGKTYLSDLQTDLIGPYQYRNLQTVLQSVELLSRHFSLTENKIRKGLASVRSSTRFMGRWQILQEKPIVLCDSAHNEGGLRYVLKELTKIPHQRLHIVLGMVKEKELDKILALFPRDARYYFARPAIPRGLDAAQLKEKAATFGLAGRIYKSVSYALRAAKRHADDNDLIYVGGSTFVVAEVVRI